mgnify:CR=1 FL=1
MLLNQVCIGESLLSQSNNCIVEIVREQIIHAMATKLEQALGEEHECLFSGSEDD